MSYKNLKLRVSGLGNKIYAGTMSSKDPRVMNDSKKDVTDEAVRAVFQHMMNEHKRKDKGEDSYGLGFEGMGEIHYFPPKEGG